MLDELFELSRHLIRVINRPYRRQFHRIRPFTGRRSILTGQRGIGKTTAVIQHLIDKFPDYATLRDCLYLPVDHFVVTQNPLYEIVRDFANQGGRLLCLDEIHKAVAWSRSLKSICDTFPEMKIIASGSSILQIQKGSHDLSRRMVLRRISGLSFREYLELTLNISLPVFELESLLANHERYAKNVMDCLQEKNVKILGRFHDYLRVGFYPYSLDYGDTELFKLTLEQSAHTAIESDLTALHPSLSGNSVRRIKRLLAVIAASVPFTPDYARLKRVLDIADDRTLKTYLDHLEKAGLIMTVRRSTSGLRSIEKPEKIYLGDPNQIFALCMPSQTAIGNVRETFFCRMLKDTTGISATDKGDFVIGDAVHVEIGGRNKKTHQLRDAPSAFLVLDDIESGAGIRIPLWLFGFLY